MILLFFQWRHYDCASTGLNPLLSLEGPKLIYGISVLRLTVSIRPLKDTIEVLLYVFKFVSLQWRHNGRDGVSNTILTIVYSTVYSSTDQRKHQSSAPLAFVREIHRWLMNSPQKCPVRGNVTSWCRHHVALDTLGAKCGTTEIDRTLNRFLLPYPKYHRNLFQNDLLNKQAKRTWYRYFS